MTSNPSRQPPLPVDPVIEAYKAGVDRTLLAENRKLTPTQRLEKLMALQELAAELRRAGEKLRQSKSKRESTP